MVGVSVLYMYTMALSFKPSLTLKKMQPERRQQEEEKNPHCCMLVLQTNNPKTFGLRKAGEAHFYR